MKASGHAGLAALSCCGSVRLFGREAADSACAACWLRSVYVCNRHLTTQTQQAAKEKHQKRHSMVLTASSSSPPSFLKCNNLFNVVFLFGLVPWKVLYSHWEHLRVCDALGKLIFLYPQGLLRE